MKAANGIAREIKPRYFFWEIIGKSKLYNIYFLDFFAEDFLLEEALVQTLLLVQIALPESCAKALFQFCKSFPFWQPEFNQL